ncbi:hypothetical protein FBR02_05610 [Anaerolineae bacterium CFX9]|nr:hypothetical protein [Anaerolineae bacterium CFX9]
MEESLTILYTQNLAGDLHLLPRLHTQIARLRGAARGRSLLLDMGDACAATIWHCAITGGRSMLVALDGMGYDAANVQGYAPADVRDMLGENVRMQTISRDYDGYLDDVYLTLDTRQAHPHAALTIFMETADETTLDSGLLLLKTVERGQIGMATVRGGRLTEATVQPLLPSVYPDPTIAGVVEFVEAEARYAQKRRERQGK